MGAKGLHLKEGVVTPNGEKLQQVLALWGPSIKPGDPAHFHLCGLKTITFISKSMAARCTARSGTSTFRSRVRVETCRRRKTIPQANPHGSFVDLYFGKYVPEMSAQQLRALLYPVLDFNARNKSRPI